MRRYDLLDEYATVIAPALGPQALIGSRPGMSERKPRPLPSVSRLRSTPTALIALLCILIALT